QNVYATLTAYYSNLTFLNDLLQQQLDDNIELLKEKDEFEYKKLLITAVIAANTILQFPNKNSGLAISQLPLPQCTPSSILLEKRSFSGNGINDTKTRGTFLKLLEATHSDKETRKEDLRSKHVIASDESSVLDENKNSKIQRKLPIEDVQETFWNEILFSKAVILNDRKVKQYLVNRYLEVRPKDDNFRKKYNYHIHNEVGIPQRSKFSPILCSIYYGDLERTELQFVKDGEGVNFDLEISG
ncbi:4576_t:CDS:2, partial [Funneliformis geosporum]